ncbi:MAG: LEPR-XLL domain-containing protein, partial [Planctomycetota bacterium]
MTREIKPLIHFEQLEPRILLSVDSLLNIAPDSGQDPVLGNPSTFVQEAELLHTNEEIEVQINPESAPVDALNTDIYKPICTLVVDDNINNDESADADLSVDNIGSALVNADITVLLNDFNEDIENKVSTTEDESPQVYVNDAEIIIEENTSIEIRGPPLSETVNSEITTYCNDNEDSEVDPNILDEYAAEVQPSGSGDLSDLYLVDPTVDYFDGQIVYLDFDGEENVTYNGPVTIEGIDIPGFVAPGDLAGQEQAIITEVLGRLEHIFAGSGIIFTTERPSGNQLYSTIYVGGNDSAFTDYGSFLGLAEQVDVGNKDPTDNAFVFSDNIVSGHTDPGSLVTHLTNLLCHETGHLLGYGHDNEDPKGGVLSIVAVIMADRFEANDSFAEAADLGTLGDLTEADLTIHEPYNDDFYLLTAAESGTLNVDILFSHSSGNLILGVYDYSQSLLVGSDSATDNESVSVAVTVGQSYYVRVLGDWDATHPDYDLVIDGPEPDIVYVDNDYDSSTPGWGTTHFDRIQDGIDAVASPGTVHVADGTYTGTDIVVEDGVVLTISAGAVVKFAPGTGLTVYGTLDVNGASGNEVVFTSFYDDVYGGDT